jgi:hypothetical protein
MYVVELLPTTLASMVGAATVETVALARNLPGNVVVEVEVPPLVVVEVLLPPPPQAMRIAIATAVKRVLKFIRYSFRRGRIFP